MELSGRKSHPPLIEEEIELDQIESVVRWGGLGFSRNFEAVDLGGDVIKDGRSELNYT